MPKVSELKKVCELLAASTDLDPYFDMEHDVLYLPWHEKIGATADRLADAGCHWDDGAGSWAMF